MHIDVNNMDGFKKKQKQLRHIAKISNIIREKYKKIKFNKFSTEEAAQNVLKPVVVPLQKLVEITENKTHHIVKPETKYQDNVDEYGNASFKSTVSRFGIRIDHSKV